MHFGPEREREAKLSTGAKERRRRSEKMAFFFFLSFFLLPLLEMAFI